MIINKRNLPGLLPLCQEIMCNLDLEKTVFHSKKKLSWEGLLTKSFKREVKISDFRKDPQLNSELRKTVAKTY